MTRIIMHGCNGHMGRVITDLVSKDDECKIVAGIDPFDDGHNDYPVFASVNDCDVEADVIIDFAAAKAEDALLDYCEKKQIPVVVCTTGLTDEQTKYLLAAGDKIPVLRSANMSLGVNLLMNINFLSEVVPYITYQTERIDGSGAPEGLKGQSIPLGSRIIAVADAYSAMTSDRPFRKAMDADKALEIMNSETDTKWDKDVVNALQLVVKDE